MSPSKQQKLVSDIYFTCIVFGLLGLAFLAMKVESAEYNFYFNNTEQGDNSTNNPNLNINGEKVSSQDTPLNTQSALTDESTLHQTGVTMPAVDDKPKQKYFRAALGFVAPIREANATGKADGFFDEQYNPGDENSLSPILSIGVFPLKYLGFNLFGTSYSGGTKSGTLGIEMEVTPVHIGLFGFEDTLEIGGLVGAWSLSRIQHVDDFIGTKRSKESAVSPFVGARVGLNFAMERSRKTTWFASAEVRGSKDHTLANLGLGMKF